MDFRTLEYILAVAKARSFTKAALAVNVAQPSLSQQIGKLERALGVTLFVRRQSGVLLTPEGERFVAQAEQLLRQRDDLLREMAERSGGMASELILGAPAITGGHMLPPILRRFTDLYPQVRVHLLEETTERLEELTVTGATDLTILALPIHDSRLSVKPLLTERIVIALPTAAPSWGKAYLPAAPFEIDLEQVAAAPFILLKRGYGFRQTCLTLCAERGFTPKIAFETSSVETAQALVAAGLGVTMIPEMVMRTDDPALHFAELSTRPTRTLVFAYVKDRFLSMAARRFMALYEETQDSLRAPRS
ncbi:LysR family transcriptional regulator [Ferroacidibacillus organovorans]|uniref:HTH lysR-type domain-containing protein n=1 Tax=Ferroacidibacillus organovorans TaxID=1765683 RepID=A0A162U582_9BACL|nr:LysR family transcriptional regulator [Ferroacidibacillus organovorans]KYP81411.1 hypothetical protein AYJ22_01210 [Ferroacidibacillus organovorans]OAG95198.1 hypothetical protein AYW79_01810 [Ferroacidibacillus organovorans]OPG15191.1 hypothetical protein B2M26_13670 [Ferroacidibacillus organovorans]